jgi:hypothetical protein
MSDCPLGGINNKIGSLQRAACGYRAKQYFIFKSFAPQQANFKGLV